MSEPTFSLYAHQVPDRPDSLVWVDVLRWMVCVMDVHDTRLAFIASCLSYAIKNEGLTPAQARACNRIYERVQEAFFDRVLVCQNTVPPQPDKKPNLSVVGDDEGDA